MELDEYWSKCLFADCDQMGEKKNKRVQNFYLNLNKTNNIYTKKIVVHDHPWW